MLSTMTDFQSDLKIKDYYLKFSLPQNMDVVCRSTESILGGTGVSIPTGV